MPHALRFRSWWFRPLIVALACLPALASHESVAVPADPGASPVGFRRSELAYEVAGERRVRELFVWYPTRAAEGRIDYQGQIGLASRDAPPAPGRHPLLLFSHGFLGSADQAIFLTETLARAGYIVVAPDHADAGSRARREGVQLPNVLEVCSWADARFRDRHEDLLAVLDWVEDPSGGSPFVGHVDRERIGALGHSLGGYIVLGLAGARREWREPRVKAVAAFSPFVASQICGESLVSPDIPVMLQGATQDWFITPLLPDLYSRLQAPKYLLILRDQGHLAWTNLISAGKTTTEAVRTGNAAFIARYASAFFDRHLRGLDRSDVLARGEPALYAYDFEVRGSRRESGRE